jgi:response regulator RpfG family c-di-GMP phosphodiesterase
VILCIDDEPHVLDALRDTLHRQFTVLTTTNGFEAFRILAEQPVEAMLSDMRMPSLDGPTLLTMAREQAPDITRVVLTGHAELQDAVTAVNHGEIFRFLLKPCPADDLIVALKAAVRQHRLVVSERVLLSETLRGAVRALSEVLALASPAAFGRAARVRYYALALASVLELEDVWHIETAALLSQVGAVALDPGIVTRLAHGERLQPAELRQIDELPRIALELLAGIPRLDEVREVLEYLGSGDHDVTTGKVPVGARIVRIANDYDLLESQGADPMTAMAELRSRDRRYDQDLVDQLAETLGVQHAQERVVPVNELAVGMILAEDIVSPSNVLHLARGTVLTLTALERVSVLQRQHIAPCFRVFVPEDDA